MTLTQATRLAGAHSSAALQRSRAVAVYYQQPRHCLQCAEIIHIRDGERPSAARGRKFCSKSCAASYNNRISIKRPRRRTCLVCNKAILSVRKYCSEQCRAFHASLRPRADFDSTQAVVAWRQRAKLRAVQYKGGRCQSCGYNKSVRALTFHHIDPTQKDFNVSSSTKAWSTIKSELDKCLLLCANCHAEVHDGLLNVSELAESDSNQHTSD